MSRHPKTPRKLQDHSLGSLKASLLALEPRIMFDGAAIATGAEVGAEQPVPQETDTTQDSENAPEADSPHHDSQDSLLASLSTIVTPSDRREIVFIDTSVNDYQTLMSGIDANAEVVLLDATRDGVEQIAQFLADRSDLDAIHLISHGNQAELQLGTARLTMDSMNGEYADELATIGQALTEQGDIMVYGCNFGEGTLGQDAAAQLAELTGGDIAASDDLTGATEQGGDWDLEQTTGEIEASVAVSAEGQDSWLGVLPGDPVASNLDGDNLAYTEGDGAVVIEQGADVTVTNTGHDFDGGGLEVKFITGEDITEDVLAIRNQGTGSGQIGVSGSNMTYEGTTIGTFTGGSGADELAITLNANATDAAVEALIENITYQNTNTVDPTTGVRVVKLELTNGDGDDTGALNTTVTVTAMVEPPPPPPPPPPDPDPEPEPEESPSEESSPESELSAESVLLGGPIDNISDKSAEGQQDKTKSNDRQFQTVGSASGFSDPDSPFEGGMLSPQALQALQGHIPTNLAFLELSKSASFEDQFFTLNKQLEELAIQLQAAVSEVPEVTPSIASGIATGTGITFSAGYLIWLLRSGSFFTTLLTTVNSMRNFDPLPVLTGGGSKADLAGELAAENKEFKGIDDIFEKPPSP